MASSSAAVVLQPAAAVPDQQPCQLQQLPRVLLQRILSSLDLYTVLEVSLVSRDFRAAAAAALSHISLGGVRDSNLWDLCGYLSSPLVGQPHLTSLNLSSKPEEVMEYMRYGSYCSMTQLPPLPSLQQLSLAGFVLQLGPADGSSEPGVLAAAGTQLTLLSIDKCRLLDGSEGLEAVSALRSLRHLYLGWAGLVRSSADDPADYRKDSNCTFPGSLLSVLVQLTHLSIGLAVDSTSLQHLSCLTGLQELLQQQLTKPWGPQILYSRFRPSDLAALQHAQQLSKVVLGIPYGEPLSASALCPAAGLHPLHAVKHLALEVQAPFDPAVLAPLAQLQHLQYTECTLVRDGPIGGPGALLGQLALHTQLTLLQLDCDFQLQAPFLSGPWPAARGLQVSALSAITASSQLQHLVLRIHAPSTGEQTPFQTVWQHVFPEQLRLPHLRHLTLASTSRCGDSQPTLGAVTSRAGSSEAPLPWQDQCLSRLAQCCPTLQGLEVMQASNQRVSVSLSSLLQLPHLTSLVVHRISRAGVRAVVAQMRGLVRLEVGCHAVPGCISAGGLARLTAVQLTHLSLTGNDSFAPQDEGEEADYEYTWGDEKAAEMRAYAPFRVVDATMAVIARLSSLQELQLRHHRNITDVGLLQLSALRQLTHLDVRHALGLLGFHESGVWVYLPTTTWARGLTLGQPVWPELLERVLRSNDPSARQQAQQAVLANRQELLGVLGPGLAAALPRMRFHRSYEEVDAEMLMWGGDVCSWGCSSGWLSDSLSDTEAARDSETDNEQQALCEQQECAAQSGTVGPHTPGTTAAGSLAGPEADNSGKAADSGSSGSAAATAAAGPSAAASAPSAAAAATAAPPMGTWHLPGSLPVESAAEADTVSAVLGAAEAAEAQPQHPGVADGAGGAEGPEAAATVGEDASSAVTGSAGPGAAEAAGGVEGAAGAAGGTSNGEDEEVIATAATAMRERLSFVVRLLATRGGLSTGLDSDTLP